MHGCKGQELHALQQEATQFTNISLCQAPLLIAYGTHHTWVTVTVVNIALITNTYNHQLQLLQLVCLYVMHCSDWGYKSGAYSLWLDSDLVEYCSRNWEFRSSERHLNSSWAVTKTIILLTIIKNDNHTKRQLDIDFIIVIFTFYYLVFRNEIDADDIRENIRAAVEYRFWCRAASSVWADCMPKVQQVLPLTSTAKIRTLQQW